MITEFKDYNLEKATTLAIKHHKGQWYGDKMYMHHIMDVVDKVGKLFHAGESLSSYITLCIVATLHDIIEDTEYTYEQCLEDFDYTVAGSVRAISKREGQSHEDYIKAVKQDYYAHKVKIADTLCNLEASIVSQEKKRIKKYTQQLLELTI